MDDAGAWSFAELSQAAARAAGTLRARGVRPGDRVAVVVPDGRRSAQALLGALRLGAIAVPLDPGTAPERLRAVLADCAPAAVVSDDLLDGTPEPVAPAAADDLACLVYTSGTTGRPEGRGPHPRRARRDRAGPGDGCAPQVTRVVALTLVSLALVGAIVLAFAGQGQAAPVSDAPAFLARYGIDASVMPPIRFVGEHPQTATTARRPTAPGRWRTRTPC